MADFADQHSDNDKVSHRDFEWVRESFGKNLRTLTTWKDLSVKELLKAKEEIEKEIFKKLGS